MNARLPVFALLLVLAACNPGRLISLGEDAHAGGAGGGLGFGGGVSAAGGGSPGGGSAGGGVAGGGAGGGGGSGGGTFDAGPPPDVVLAAATCGRIDACLQGATYGTATRYDWMSACVLSLTQPRQTQAQFKEQAQGTMAGFMIGTLPLPSLLWLSDPTMRACLETATTCGGVEACWNRGAPVNSCTTFGEASCNGTTLEVCAMPSASFASSPTNPHVTFSYDCADMGLGCKRGGNTSGLKTWGCGTGTCDPVAFAPSCAGSVAHRCAWGIQGDLHCPSGTTCGLVDAGGGVADARCVGQGPACAPSTFKDHCTGGQLTQCAERREATFDCPQGTTCQTGPDGAGFCGVAADCSQWGEAPRCLADGGLTICSLGRRVELGCGALGLTACTPATSDHAPRCQ